MASGIFSGQRGTSSGKAMQNVGWIPVALGAAAIVAGLGGRKKSAAALAFTAVAAGTAGTVRGNAYGKAQGNEPEVERSLEIGKSADELRRRWLDPGTLSQIMAGFATVQATGDGRMHWKVEGPLGRTYEWDTETVDRAGEGVGWRSLSDGALASEGWLRFHPAPADRGTVVTLRIRFEPPGGALGGEVLKLLGTTPLELVAEGMLRRFKNLVETGEIPTTARQPAARADTR